MPDTAMPTAGHNSRGAPIEEFYQQLNDDLPAQLARDCKEMVDKTQALVDNARSVPDVIKDDAEEANATDIASQLNKHWKMADSRRLGINALPRKAVDIINNFFGSRIIDEAKAAVERIDPAVTKYKREKIEREKRIREEAARKAAEEAERHRQAAEAAQRKQREAEAARLKAIEDQKRAEAAAARAKQEAIEAEQRRKDAEIRRIEQERLAEEATTKRKKADAERAARKAQEDADRADRERVEAKDRQERERAAAATAKTDAALTKHELSDANKEAKTASAMVKHAETDVRRAETSAGAKASTMSGSRGDYGGQSSLRTVWKGRVVDRAKLDLGALRDFFTDDDLQKAVDNFVRLHKGGRQLKGAVIEEQTSTVFR